VHRRQSGILRICALSVNASNVELVAVGQVRGTHHLEVMKMLECYWESLKRLFVYAE
jgi:hypothetical protein